MAPIVTLIEGSLFVMVILSWFQLSIIHHNVIDYFINELSKDLLLAKQEVTESKDAVAIETVSIHFTTDFLLSKYFSIGSNLFCLY